MKNLYELSVRQRLGVQLPPALQSFHEWTLQVSELSMKWLTSFAGYCPSEQTNKQTKGKALCIFPVGSPRSYANTCLTTSWVYVILEYFLDKILRNMLMFVVKFTSSRPTLYGSPAGSVKLLQSSYANLSGERIRIEIKETQDKFTDHSLLTMCFCRFFFSIGSKQIKSSRLTVVNVF